MNIYIFGWLAQPFLNLLNESVDIKYTYKYVLAISLYFTFLNLFFVLFSVCDIISNDVMAIIGVTNASSLPTIQSYSATFEVPFLSLGSSQNVSSYLQFQLSMRPPIMAAAVDVLCFRGCQSALYLYDSDEG